MMKQQAGFTLIELIVFMVVSGILLSTIILGANTTLIKVPVVMNQWKAVQTAQRCMEWYWSAYRANGTTPSACPATPTPALCAAPTGFTVSTAVTCTTWNSDTTYATFVVTVTGLANASLTAQLAQSY